MTDPNEALRELDRVIQFSDFFERERQLRRWWNTWVTLVGVDRRIDRQAIAHGGDQYRAYQMKEASYQLGEALLNNCLVSLESTKDERGENYRMKTLVVGRINEVKR